jgi:hypothetical protein
MVTRIRNVGLLLSLLSACQSNPAEPAELSSSVGRSSGAREAGPPQTVLATSKVHFHPRSGLVSPTDSVAGGANVHQKFVSLEEACLNFVFSEPLGPGDALNISIDGQESGGFFNEGSFPQSTRTLCWDNLSNPTILDLFRDGRAKFIFRIVPGTLGSVSISSVTVSVTGTTVR